MALSLKQQKQQVSQQNQELLQKLGQALFGRQHDLMRRGYAMKPLIQSPLSASTKPESSSKPESNNVQFDESTADGILAKATLDAAKSAQKKQVQGLVEQGVDLEQITNVAMSRAINRQNQPQAPAPAKRQAPTQMAGQQMLNGSQMLSGAGGGGSSNEIRNPVSTALQVLFSSFTGIPTPGALDFVRQEKIKSAEQIPMSRAKKEELGYGLLAEYNKQELKSVNDFFSNIMEQKPLSAESAKGVSLARSAKNSLEAIDSVFQQDPKALRNWDRPGNAIGQQLRVLRDNIENSLLRIESGAAISEDEKKFIRTLTTPQGIKAFLEDPSTTRLKIQQIRDKLDGYLNLIDPNYQTRQFVQNALAQGKSKAEIITFLRQKGKVV